jgi:hypothetical protein
MGHDRLSVDISKPGTYTNAQNDTSVVLTPDSIGSGTHVDSFIMHFAPPQIDQAVTGTMSFNAPVLGVVALFPTLDASDSIVGNPQAVYPTGDSARAMFDSGFEPDIITLSSDRRSIFFQTSVIFLDEFRVVTEHGLSADPIYSGPTTPPVFLFSLSMVFPFLSPVPSYS